MGAAIEHMIEGWDYVFEREAWHVPLLECCPHAHRQPGGLDSRANAQLNLENRQSRGALEGILRLPYGRRTFTTARVGENLRLAGGPRHQ